MCNRNACALYKYLLDGKRSVRYCPGYGRNFTDIPQSTSARHKQKWMQLSSRYIEPVICYHISIVTLLRRFEAKCIMATAVCLSVCVSVCLSVPPRIPTLQHGPGCNLDEW